MIPKQIFQTWKTKTQLSPLMLEAVQSVKQLNPEYSYTLFDDFDCETMLQSLSTHDPRFLQAYLRLKPGAFRADLWRYIMLYYYGGVYLDVDFHAYVPLRELIEPTDDLVSAKDRPQAGIYQAFLACRPHHPAIWRVIELTLDNILHQRPYHDKLAVTGPIACGMGFNLYRGLPPLASFVPGENDMGHSGERLRLYDFNGEDVIDLNGRKIFHGKYDGFVVENGPHEHYTTLKSYFVEDPPTPSASSTVVLPLPSAPQPSPFITSQTHQESQPAHQGTQLTLNGTQELLPFLSPDMLQRFPLLQAFAPESKKQETADDFALAIVLCWVLVWWGIFLFFMNVVTRTTRITQKKKAASSVLYHD